MDLLLGTHNPAKIKELGKYLHQLLPHITILSPSDVVIHDKPEETGKTFLENAKQKAHFFASKSGIPVLSDDGGLEIDVLHGLPGVRSRRWIGKNATDEELVTYTLDQMKDVPHDKRNARFTVSLCLYDSQSKKEYSAQEVIEGTIATRIKYPIPHGFPYRSIFIVSAYNKYFSELDPQEHAHINHRYKATVRIAQKISDWYHIS